MPASPTVMYRIGPEPDHRIYGIPQLPTESLRIRFIFIFDLKLKCIPVRHQITEKFQKAMKISSILDPCSFDPDPDPSF